VHYTTIKIFMQTIQKTHGACILSKTLVLYVGMKKDIHPTYYPDAKVACACGNKFEVGSTQKEIHTEICAKCHPFYTGKQNLIDTAGRVDRFKAMVKKTSDLSTKKSKKSTIDEKTKKQLDNKAKLQKIKRELDAK
jgi:large subunit ribosomal protein L31